jgi:hypothetical protein
MIDDPNETETDGVIVIIGNSGFIPSEPVEDESEDDGAE